MNAPIETLPFELLSDIMLLALAGTPERSMVMSLCKLCSRWRPIAIQTPELWIVPLPRMKSWATIEVAYSATAFFVQRSAPYLLLLTDGRVYDLNPFFRITKQNCWLSSLLDDWIA
ncbi:hypothetical protein FB45DRAFT_328403 [Roridomyces roridus]|uniref:F-box domain-containing protein n=1 Tax=Roridomyces roridus TaxID=1738132 RepID=A0AAD7B520_9AGAR|nr:hypothetical protein FB45DRAFT_328403 [Roridomyces roridus]